MKTCQKDFSQEKSDSSNLLLSIMKRTEDMIILKFIPLVKLLLTSDKTLTVSFSLNFRISESIELRSSKRGFH